MYVAYSMPGLEDARLQPPSTAYDPNVDQMFYGTSPLYEPRAIYEAAQSTFRGFRKVPELSFYNPDSGPEGSLICVYLNSSYDLHTQLPLTASLMFATRHVPAESFTPIETQERNVPYKYLVKAKAPPFSDIGSSNPRIPVPIRVQLQQQPGIHPDLIDVGTFLYTDGQEPVLQSSYNDVPRKRKVSVASPVQHVVSEPPSIQQPHHANLSDYGPYSYGSGENFAYPQSLHSVDVTSMQRRLTPYGRSQNQQNPQDEYPASPAYGSSGDAGMSQSLMRPPMAQTSTWSPAYSAPYHPNKSPRLDLSQSYDLNSASSPDSANPPLARTTKLQQPNSRASTPAAPTSGETWNPYLLNPNKAVLKIRGNLESMREDWTPEEVAAKRRLVRFGREQNGTMITAYFRPAKPDERPSAHEMGEPRISCIYWEERQEFCVTSVDTISLLEYLVRGRFQVEEKNRIRRNLEGFRPSTVAKLREDTEEFFKVIMGFPNPKPRNIEKDVKVFAWNDLGMALKKIISKYVSCRNNWRCSKVDT